MQNMATNASPAELYRLARAAAAVKPSLITTCVVLGGIGNIGGASVVLPYVDQARRFGDEAREDATLELRLTLTRQFGLPATLGLCAQGQN